MRSVRGYTLLVRSLVLIGILTMGCAKEVHQGMLVLNPGASERDEFVYVPEFSTLSTEARIDSNSLLMTQDTLYYVQTTVGESSKQLVSQSLMTVGEPTQVSLDLGRNTTPYRMICDIDGSFLILLHTIDRDLPQSSYKLVKYNQTGQKLSELELSEVSDGGNVDSYEKHIAVDAEGKIYVADNQTIWLYKKSGDYHGQIELSGNLSSMATGKDGKVYIAYQQSNIPWLAELNFNSKSLKKTYDVSWSGSNATMTTGIDSNLLYFDGKSLFEIDPETEKVSKILNWVDCNMDGLSVHQVTKLTDGRIAATTLLWEKEIVVEVATLKKMPISEVPDRETIVLGCLYEFTSLLQKLVDDFNQISDQYEVVVETYADSGKYNDVMDAVTRINTEIAIGHAPDILVLASNYINLDSFAEKGVFVDLNEMIANSQMLKKEDILDSVISTFTYDKKLVGLPLFFSIDTLYGKTSVVGEKNGWTIQELKALMDEYPDRNIIKYAMKDDMLLSLISLNKDTFIDWENGRCYFDGNEFKELLELMNRFPASVDKEYFKNVEPLLYRHTVRLNNFQNYQLILAVMQEPVNFIGFPTPDGTKGIGLVEDGGVYTIISQSKHKEGAWAFIEYLLTQEIPFDSHFSVNKNVLDQQIERAKNGIYGYITDNFEPVPGPDGEMPLRSKVSISYDGEMIPIYAPTQEDIDEFYALIDSAVGIIPRSDDILKIISEEAAAYFIGIKTLDQVADIIQNRAQIYVSENQ